MRSIWHHPTTLLKQLIKRNVPAARRTPFAREEPAHPIILRNPPQMG